MEFKNVLIIHKCPCQSLLETYLRVEDDFIKWYFLMGSTDNDCYKLKCFRGSTENLSEFIVLVRIKMMKLFTRTHRRLKKKKLGFFFST